ncbi:hypothetical protein LINGRAHAP2_LOCUS26523 [Linum grandiflorum]
MESQSGDFAKFSECPKSNTTTKLLRRSSSSSIHDSDQLKPPQVVRTSVSDPNATDSSSDEEEKESEFSRFRQRQRRPVKSINEITVVEVSSSSCSGAAGSSWEEEVQRSDDRGETTIRVDNRRVSTSLFPVPPTAATS